MDISLKARMYLPVLIILVIGLLCSCGSPAATLTPPDETSEPPQTTTPLNEPSTNTPDRVDVVYFYRGTPPPCHCMQVVGDNIKYTVEVNFGDKLASGKLTFKMLASESKANADTVRKYKAPPFGLFVSVVKGNAETIYPVEEIWGLTGDEDRFKEFVKSTIEKSLKGQL